MRRANYLGVPAVFNLNHACNLINQAYDSCCYLVGSSLEKRDFRDVDVRMILSDEEFDQMFPGENPDRSYSCLRLSLMNTVFSEWLKARTGLPVDFQFQRRTNANKEYEGQRQALGLFYASKTAADETKGDE